MQRPRLKLHWQILIALLLGIAAGFLSGPDGTFFNIRFYSVYSFLGTLFINALKMLIVPLITSSIISGVAGLGRGAEGSLGRLGLKTLLFYAITVISAILAGLLMVNLVHPGIVDGQPARHLLGLGTSKANVAATVGHAGSGELTNVFLQLIPANIFEAAVHNQMLGLIFFSILFGYFITKVSSRHSDLLIHFWEAVFAVMMKITEWVIRFAPLGVFALVAKVVADTGFDAFRPLLTFALTSLTAFAIHALITLPLLVWLVTRANPYRMYRAMGDALLMAFSTASSSATLPVTMQCVEKNAGVSNRVSSFVLPLGATINMDGTALYECVAAMFMAQAYGLHLSFGVQFLIVLMALLTSIGVAGIPSASMVAIAIILSAVGLPVEAIGVLFAIDRPLDMLRTALNVFGDSVCAVVVANLEGEKNLLSPGYERQAV